MYQSNLNVVVLKIKMKFLVDKQKKKKKTVLSCMKAKPLQLASPTVECPGVLAKNSDF